MKMGNHGSHHTCMMCSVAKATGMMKNHPDNCNCEKEQKSNKEDKK